LRAAGSRRRQIHGDGLDGLGYFAEPRFTRDVDIIVDLEAGEERAFVRLFEPDYYISEDAVRGAIQNQSMFNALHMKEAFKVDFIIRKKSIFHHNGFQRRKYVDYNGINLSMISKEDLIVAKMLWAKETFSDMQLRDIKSLLATGCDVDYVKQWVKTLYLDSIFERAQRYE
jgi:hypothetical protein